MVILCTPYESRGAIWFTAAGRLSGIGDIAALSGIVKLHSRRTIVPQLIRRFCADDHSCNEMARASLQ
jgi:hypothetical protein